MKNILIILLIVLLNSHQALSQEEPGYLRTEVPITILSANDGEIRAKDGNEPEDSITVIHLRPDNPPVVQTIYGTVPNSIVGSPHMAIAANARYGFVVGHPWSASFWWPNRNNPEVLKDHSSEGQLSVINLASSDLQVISTFKLSGCPTMAVTLPDDERIIVGGMESFFIFKVVNNSAIKVSSISTSVDVSSFDVCSKGQTIIASGKDGIHIYEIVGNNIEYRHSVESPNDDLPIVKPFSPRIAPSDEYAIVLNGGGINEKGTSDDALIIALALDEPKVVGSIPKLADGLESLAFHPDGHMAVICCLDDYLAVIDLSSNGPRLLYRIHVGSIAEGIEFTPNGKKLFVGLTLLDRIAVFDVQGYRLSKSPFVIKTGFGPSSMAIGSEF